METDPKALRQILRAGPSVLARQLGSPEVLRGLQNPEELRFEAERIDEPRQESGFEIFDEGEEILVVSELPGVAARQLRIYGYVAQVVVHVRGGSRHSVRLPQQIDPNSISYAFQNNILTVRARTLRATAVGE